MGILSALFLLLSGQSATVDSGPVAHPDGGGIPLQPPPPPPPPPPSVSGA